MNYLPERYFSHSTAQGAFQATHPLAGSGMIQSQSLPSRKLGRKSATFSPAFPVGRKRSSGDAGLSCNQGPRSSYETPISNPSPTQMHIPPWLWFRRQSNESAYGALMPLARQCKLLQTRSSRLMQRHAMQDAAQRSLEQASSQSCLESKGLSQRGWIIWHGTTLHVALR